MGGRCDHGAVTENVPQIANDFLQRPKSTESGHVWTAPGWTGHSEAGILPLPVALTFEQVNPSCTAFHVSRSSLRCAKALDKHASAVNRAALPDGGSPCTSISSSTTSPAFSVTRKRRKSFPSETQVRRGDRVVHGDVELTEKLGRNDLCPCGSGRRFQTLLHGIGILRWRQPRLLFSGSDGPAS